MRTFIAVELEDATREGVIQLQARLKQRVENLKWARADQLHLTLVFIGEIGEESARDLSAALDEIARGQAPFRMSFDRLGMFPPRGPVSVLWLGVGDGRAELIALQSRCVARLAAMGYPPEDRPYQPHLTLARNRDAGASRRIRGIMEERIPIQIEAQSVHAVTLFRSILGSPAARHEVISRHFIENVRQD